MTGQGEVDLYLAFDYFIEQLYDAQRGYAGAYAIKVGDDLITERVGTLPAWRDLTVAEQAIFVATAREALGSLVCAIANVAVIHHKRES